MCPRCEGMGNVTDIDLSQLFDESRSLSEGAIGLHPHDIQRMNDLLLQLRDKGNTVLVVARC